MESFAQLKRRTTDLFANIPQSMPAAPTFTTKKKTPLGMKGTWEKIDIPSLTRSSHSLNVVNGSAYIFGGDAQPGRPVDNDMHVVVLPYNSAGADYYRIKAAPPKTYTPPPGDQLESEPEKAPEQAAPAEVEKKDDKGKGKEKDPSSSLDDVPLASPTTGADPSFDDDEEDEGDAQVTPTTSASAKGKQPEEPPSPASLLPDVPPPRAGHASAVVGHRIFLFGGRDPTSSQPLNEYGRVWVFDTRTHAWSYLDPVPPAPGVTLLPLPGPRHGHAATAIDRPRDFAPRGGPKRTQTWTQWAQGDSAEIGIPQAPIVGNLALNARDEEDDGYGTLFVHGGIVAAPSRASLQSPADSPTTAAGGKRSNDLWAFDVRSRVWTELPAAPGPARNGAAICISKSRLFRFGGSDGTAPIGGQLDFVHLEVETFDDGVAKGEVSVRARGGWQTISANDIPGAAREDGKEVQAEIPLVGGQDWPSPRAFAGLEAVTSGGGREYIVLVGGEAPFDETPGRGRQGRVTTVANDAWAFQVPPLGMTAASLGDAFWQAIGKPTGEGRWSKLVLSSYDEENDTALPMPRGWAATAPMGELEEAGIVVWGGVSEAGSRLGDGWILRLGD
ncbi:hypothetical protein B0T11DRAFT_355116 [Plectosphaerella cucumerina]|jgi:hypothetical protein|uniref:Kelch domain-containing protein n=1 Tax=Plectosphaerella cucumerina TaxID=40658 RepID=A0A8K0X1Q1_9PEZI|nr:hypothetical protein B0T11DRAFT_355116 [Plectosphaerella cucumerina]